MAFRIPRGYEVNREWYNEVCEGIRPTPSAVPFEAYVDLPPVTIDETHHDPIVIESGTLVGIDMGATVNGACVPAHATPDLNLIPHSESSKWGLPTAAITIADGPVAPLGVCYERMYSFALQKNFTNYKRSHTVPFLMGPRVIRIPAITALEEVIQPGKKVMLSSVGNFTGSYESLDPVLANVYNNSLPAGRYEEFDDAAPNTGYIVGTCLKNILLGTGTTTAGTLLMNDLANFTPSAELNREFPGLGRVQTNPGLALSGSGTKGVPGYLLGARANAAGEYRALVINIRI